MPEQPPDSNLLSAIFDAAVDAIIVSDKRGQITQANNAAVALFGYDLDELTSRNVRVLMPETMAERHDSFISNHIETGEKKIIDIGREVEGLRKDGTVFPLHLSVGRAVVDRELLFIAILHDLSYRKSTEEALARSQRLDAIGQMTGGIAHDFNNLLTVVIGNLELLQMRKDDETANELVTDALEAAEMGADLTSQLMVFARKSILRPEPLDLNEACQKSLAILRRTLGANYDIQTRLEYGIAQVEIDPTQLQSAIVNMAINAKDAMPGGGKLVFETTSISIDDLYVAQETDVAPGTYVRLSISDTGQGMTENAQRRAFEPFFTTKPVGKGTGLGLSMIYGFVRQSGGHITIYSELGKGTTFSLYFPAYQKTASDEQAKQVEAPDLHLGDAELVLVVEDNPQVRRLSVQRIRELGYRTLEAETGDEALQILAERPDIALVFTDLVMPGATSGLELAAKVSADRPDTKVLLTSGYADEIAQPEAESAIHFDLLRKPYRQADLAKMLHTLLSDH